MEKKNQEMKQGSQKTAQQNPTPASKAIKVTPISAKAQQQSQ